MITKTEAKAAVRFDADAVRIGETPQVLLCASLFYFRIPRALWRERMEQLKAFGYNSIDVYFPWNYHERAEGEWDFSGERDIAAFLTEAADAGLYVVARPGPYICSEWDGGALPAYLLTKGVKLRDNDAGFLGYVSKWFDQVLPIIKQQQAGEGGTVIGVQLDNELDFYDCHDPQGYISALRDMALSHGITVPLFACAGQGGLLQASGLASNVVPSCNFYPDNRDAEFEQKVLHYGQAMAKLGYPLLVTETNRAHYLLRRLLSCGAKLLGPYLQVSGTDFGFTNATNNWGKPLAFMTSDYDFGGMISPEGHIREEAYEGRLLGRMIAAYGASLAQALPEGEGSSTWAISGDRQGIAGPFTLQLSGGGSLLFVTNLDERDKRIRLSAADGAKAADEQSSFTLQAGRSLALPFEVPLSLWGIEGVLQSSTAELYYAEQSASGASLAFHTDGSGEIVIRMNEPKSVNAVHAASAWSDGKLTIRFDGLDASCCSVVAADGAAFKLLITNRMKALYMEGVTEEGSVIEGQSLVYSDQLEEAASEWSLSGFQASSLLALQAEDSRLTLDSADYLEEAGICRGFAGYEASVALTKGELVQGYLIKQGSDVISLYADGQYAGTAVSGGGSAYLPLVHTLQEGKLHARVEIWGHSNFDDVRLPGLRLHAMKGLRGIAAITEVRDLSGNWRVYRAADRSLRKELIEGQDDSMWPMISFGGWMSPDHPAFEYYRKTFRAAKSADSWTLHFKGLQSLARLFVDGKDVGAIHPFDPFVDISEHVTAGEDVVLTVFVERVLGLPSGQVYVYEGIEAVDWTLQGAEEAELLAHAESKREEGSAVQLPIALEPGETAWLRASTVNSEAQAGWRAKVTGTGLKLTVFLGDRIVGRLWLPGGESRPVLTGGRPDSFYLPGAWYEAGKGELTILLEAVDRERQGRLDAITFISV
ncbi:beta-galactosidase [Paenibacillus endophyticus]|uniref:Beta-galactosidase n=1 Tax=Paenibacillus endophyticus TaxID=1294268 RepID=A0A7W5GAP6_9BACL|nr:beta-galactosidase [Paenibacillus endophyticus]MBB3153459.1 beta-galactosidase [Paenibacillus endophyticus]